MQIIGFSQFRLMTKLFICTIAFICYSSIASCQLSFPEKCVGEWTGKLLIYQKGQIRDSVPVKLTVKSIDSISWTWKTEYLSEKMPVTKDYIFRVIDKARNKYVMDEGEGVILNESVYDNKCLSVFLTDEILITSRYELISRDSLYFEVSSSKPSELMSGELRNYEVGSLQAVIFKKVNN